MGKKKEKQYMNVYIDKSILEEFSAFCNEVGQTKSLAAERALVLYMKAIRKSSNLAKNGNQ